MHEIDKHIRLIERTIDAVLERLGRTAQSVPGASSDVEVKRAAIHEVLDQLHDDVEQACVSGGMDAETADLVAASLMVGLRTTVVHKVVERTSKS